jgi:4-carboxymuconolactone decarboxylase
VNRRTTRHLPARMSAAQRRLYDEIANGSRAAESAFPLLDQDGALTGPFDTLLLAPEIGHALQAVGAALRFHGNLTDRAREMAILVVGHHYDSEFEVFAHEAVGRRIGLTESDLEALAACRAPGSADEYEAAVVGLVCCLLRDGDLDDAAYSAAVRTLGEAGVFEVNALVGYYSLLAAQLRIFRVPTPGLPTSSGLRGDRRGL